MTSSSAAARTDRGRAPRRIALGVVAGLLATVLTSCLMPGEHDPTGRAPIGNMEAAYAAGSGIRVTGWALDPDTAAPVEIGIAFHGTTGTFIADRDRPDVAAAYPGYGAAHGFDVTSGALGTGIKQVCVWIINVGEGQDRVLGCQDIQTGFDETIGSYETLTQVAPNTMRATGWACDGETDDSIELSYRVDDGPAQRLRTHVVRPDVNAVHGRSGVHGFSFDMTVASGGHRVCIVALGPGRGGDLDLGCRSVDVNDLPAVGPGAGISSSQAVGPFPGHPLTGIDRDGGISTRLRDGSTLWLFGDSLEPRAGGGHRYFVNNTAAWAAPGEPTVTRDAVASGNVPYTFVTPAGGFVGGCPPGFAAVMWPLSATTRQVGSIDRVTAFFGNVCLNGNEAKSRGVALVEWDYTPGQFNDLGVVGRRLQGRVVQQTLFPVGAEYGTASMMEGGLLYAYECGRPSDDRTGVIWPNDPAYTGCTVARVDPADASRPSSWRYWNGSMAPNWTASSNWVADPAAARTMTIPSVGSGGDKQLPVSSLSVVDDPQFGLTMVYSPWPGFTQEVFVRSGASPVGPWSNRTLVNLPGCTGEWADGSRRYCYASTAQPWRSSAGQLGIGYYDQYTATNPSRGSYFAASAPLAG